MGMTFKRLGFAILALSALLLPFGKTTTSTRKQGEDQREVRLGILRQELRDARQRWSALVQRDSALALLSRVSKRPTRPTIYLQGFSADIKSGELQAALEKKERVIGTTDPSIATLVYVYNVTTLSNETIWASYWGNLIVQRDGLTWCVTIVPGEVRNGNRLLIGRDLMEMATGPCDLLSAFGRPGRGIGTWLEATRFTPARSNSWLTGAPLLYEGGRAPWGWLFERNIYSWTPLERTAMLRLFGDFQVAEVLAPPYYYGAPNIRCLIGEERSCVDAVLHSGIVTARDPGIPRDLTVGSSLLRPDTVTLATPRPPQGSYLADLIRAEGRERFRIFWKSDLPFESAFEAAFGESLGRWTSRWARNQWQQSWEMRYGHKTIVLGSNISGSWPLLVALWSALTLAAVSWAAYRKQVTL
jgi:hypothetical protein